MRTAILVVHIVSGALGLIVGPLAMAARKRPRRGGVHWHRRLGLAYQVMVAGLCGSAVALVALTPSLWWLGLIAVATQAAAVAGWVTRPSARPTMVSLHIGAMCGSYISVVTAFLVVNLDGLVWWLLPTVVGSPLIAWISRRARLRYAALRPAV